MSRRRINRALAILLSVLATSTAVLGGMLYGSFAETNQWRQRAANMESALAVAQASLADEQSRFAEKSAEADALRTAANLSEELQGEIAAAQQDLQAAQAEAKRQTSLASASETRAGILSTTNEELRETIARLQERARDGEAEIERLNSLLTACEEELAGTQALYQEASLSLAQARDRSGESELTLAELSIKLTQVEEDYAGASALLAESDAEIARARSLVLTYYNSAEAARLASEAKQAELDLLHEQMAEMQAALVPEAQHEQPAARENTKPESLSGSHPILDHVSPENQMTYMP